MIVQAVTVTVLLSQLPSSHPPPSSRDCVIKLINQPALELSRAVHLHD